MLVSCPESWTVVNVETNSGNTSAIVWNRLKEPDLKTAINQLVDSELVMECSNAARIVRLGVLRELLGHDKMNTLVKDVSTILMKKRQFTLYNFMAALSWKFYEGVRSINEGEFYAFPFVNSRLYAELKPNGDESNHNVVCLTNGTYVGFAPGFFEQSKTYEEMEERLYTVLMDDSFLREEDKARHSDRCKKLSFDVFKAQRSSFQKNYPYNRLNLQAVLDYIDQ